MLRTLKQFKYWIKGENFPMEEMLANGLYDARIRLMEAENALEWSISNVEYLKNRVARLEQNHASFTSAQRAIEFTTEPKFK